MRSRAKTAALSLVDALPDWPEALCGSFLWAVAVALSALASLWRITAWIDFHLIALTAVFFCGGLVAYVPARLAAHIMAADQPPGVRFCASFVSLTVITIVAAALSFAIENLPHDIDWSAFGQLSYPYLDIVSSLIEAQVRFIVLGVRLFLPAGLPALVLASLWLMRRIR